MQFSLEEKQQTGSQEVITVYAFALGGWELVRWINDGVLGVDTFTTCLIIPILCRKK